MEVRIYQVTDLRNCNYLFRDYDTAREMGFSLSDYSVVYTYNTEEEPVDLYLDDFLEEVFKKFNIHRPTDFRGHSLSVSDLVELSSKSVKKALFYVDSFGFVRID